MKNYKLRTISACIRNIIGAGNYTPIVITKGNRKPHYNGSSWCYKTKSGRPIYHPSAYSKVGWSNMVYHNSTLKIVVGCQYILTHYRFNKKYRNDPMIKMAVKVKLPAFI